MKVSFPLRSEGVLGRAASVASSHPSYQVEGRNGTARARVELELPADWRPLDEFSGLLRGEKEAEYAVDGLMVPGEELFAGLRCFFAEAAVRRFGKGVVYAAVPGREAALSVQADPRLR